MPARRLQTLNEKHLAFIFFKVGGYTHAEIAKILDLSPVTMKAWSKDPHIREVRDKLQDQLGEGAKKYLESLLPQAIFTMATIMKDGNSERIRLDAASRIMDKAMPQETKTTISGDPTAPILIDLLKSEQDKQAMDSLAELTPEQRAEWAASLEKLETMANSGSAT